jgi:hypothetical protein
METFFYFKQVYLYHCNDLKMNQIFHRLLDFKNSCHAKKEIDFKQSFTR